MLLSWGAVIAGFLLLMWSADRFVWGAAAVARNLGVAPLIIGMTFMGFGTSAPEILVAVMASLNGNPGLAIGNAIGSNTANIALVLGITALITPMKVDSNILRREFPVLFVIMGLSLVLMWDGSLERFDGFILLLGLVLMVVWMVRLGLRTRTPDPLQEEFAIEIPSEVPTNKALLWIIIGLLILSLSSRLLVWGAVDIARSFEVSDVVIGLTIVAIGTSLPELAASVVGALKGEHEMVLGNVIGSNMFNMLAVLSVPGLLHPGSFDPEVLTRHFSVMVGVTVAMFIMAYGFRGPGQINRLEGGILVLTFCVYMTSIYFTAI